MSVSIIAQDTVGPSSQSTACLPSIIKHSVSVHIIAQHSVSVHIIAQHSVSVHIIAQRSVSVPLPRRHSEVTVVAGRMAADVRDEELRDVPQQRGLQNRCDTVSRGGGLEGLLNGGGGPSLLQ